MASSLAIAAASLVFFCALTSGEAEARTNQVERPERTLWMSDLHDPVNDPDDHYDLAVGFGSGLLENALIVVDRATGRRPARASVSELARISGNEAPSVVRQGAIERQIRFLRRSPRRSVRVITLGSLASLAALLERNRPLLVSRVKEVWVFAGDASMDAQPEYNVNLDPLAFRRVLNSDLPVWWVPCFDGGSGSAGTSSFLLTSDEVLMAGLRPAVRGWFERFVGDRFGQRGLWAAGNLSGFRPQGVRWQSGRYEFSRDGVLTEMSKGRSNVKRFVVFDRGLYEGWLLRVTRRVLSGL